MNHTTPATFCSQTNITRKDLLIGYLADSMRGLVCLGYITPGQMADYEAGLHDLPAEELEQLYEVEKELNALMGE